MMTSNLDVPTAYPSGRQTTSDRTRPRSAATTRSVAPPSGPQVAWASRPIIADAPPTTAAGARAPGADRASGRQSRGGTAAAPPSSRQVRPDKAQAAAGAGASASASRTEAQRPKKAPNAATWAAR